MSGFADLVPQAQPALLGGGLVASGTAGRTWLWRFTDVTDAEGDNIDLSAVTGTCSIVRSPGGTEVIELDFDGGDGEFTIGADEADTADLYTGTGSKSVLCYWSLILDDGTDSVQVWGVDNSKFTIHRGA